MEDSEFNRRIHRFTRDALADIILTYCTAYVNKISAADPIFKAFIRKCCQKFYRDKTYPYVTVQEIREKINESEEIDKRQEENLCNVYKELFQPLDLDTFRPRSLKHQARLVIRNKISEDKMEVDIHFLGIPEKLKAYLLLKQ